MTENEPKIIFYGTSWCYSSRRARTMLDQHNLPYDWIDIDYDEEGRAYVEKVNNGYRSVPTIVFPDGSILVEPTTNDLKNKLGVS